jgi:glycosyltransferase involved in cell wall biosynthesis
MKIGFDISQTGKQKAGCGYFADSLIRHLAEVDAQNQYLLYPTFGDSYWDPDWASGTCRIYQPNFHQGLGHRTQEAAKLFWEHPPEDFEAKLGNPDIVHANNFYCPRGLRNARLVYTLYDLSFLAHPEWTTEANRTTCFQGVFHASLYADLILSISHFSRTHFLEIFPHYPAERVFVAHPASRFSPSPGMTAPKELSSLHGPFWLSVGTLEPRKNHKKLIRAYSLLKAKRGTSPPLVLAGSEGWLMPDFKEELNSLNLRQDVLLLGYTEDATLQWLYQNCIAFIFPSFFEGFGMPVLEAMSLGAPVICSRVSSLPEIVDRSGILVDPANERELFERMDELLQDPALRHRLSEQARQQASKFSWKSSATLLVDKYIEVFSHPKIHTDPHGIPNP